MCREVEKKAAHWRMRSEALRCLLSSRASHKPQAAARGRKALSPVLFGPLDWFRRVVLIVQCGVDNSPE
uniref:Uncharacterized protein n=1 Tax=Anopheles quadriannulatus TaxID=34691 RepID=A0A182XTH0_ANOQN